MNDRVAGVTPDSFAEPAPDGRSARWDAHRVTRRRELIAAAVDVIAQHGSDVGLETIAAAAGTSKPVIYRYFADRDALHRAVAGAVAGEIVRTLEAVHTSTTADTEPDPGALLRRAVDAYLHLVEDRPALFRFVIRQHPDPEPGPHDERTTDPIADVLAAELATQLTGCGLDARAARPWGDAAVGFIRAASLWWLEHPTDMTRPQLTEYLSALLWGGAAGVFQSAGRDVDARPAPGVFPPASPAPATGSPGRQEP